MARRNLKTNIQLKPEIFLLGLMDSQIRKEPWEIIFIYDYYCKTYAQKLKDSEYPHGGLIGENDRTSRDGKVSCFGQRKINYIY